EVAFRAAFKAVTAGKQVAILAPTTILVEQHYNNFKERLSPFPINIEMLSRFRSKKEQHDVIKGLSSGAYDIVIGTHRLVQKDTTFKDLGLLIIDEEQRFGVKHKEKLKALKNNIDVVTMTATPIPRTLYLSLSGIRDISMINTPPLNRSSIRTYVMESNPQVIKEAILRELERGGQIYFIHNIVNSIQQKAQQIKKLVPNARIGVAHGQMHEKLLEKVMLDFIHKKIDVLVCTTIIESGIDIPSVNTIIINHAGRFGLADLYQLRGRVGRSNVKAFAYLLYEKGEILNYEAMNRLSAITEYTSLGSGYKIALRDLEIRGAGNVLGAQQHGHMLAIGFDLYNAMLENSVKKLKGLPQDVEKLDIKINIKLDAFIPHEYIREEKERIATYKRLDNTNNLEELKDLSEEITDRYGKLPPPINNLIRILTMRYYASIAKIKSIDERKGSFIIHNIMGKKLVYKNTSLKAFEKILLNLTKAGKK
ncbi:MAG: TRCF domain-containing protein, partial [bacterium]